MKNIVSLTLTVSVLLLAAVAARAEVLLEQQSLYSTVLVKKTGSVVCLLFSVRTEQRNQSCINQKKPKEMVFAYTRMSMATLLFNPEPERILVIGLGGGTLPMAFTELYPQAEIDSIEIDPVVVKVAEDYFGFVADERNRVHTQDARIWVRRANLREQKFDIIVLDAFNGEYIPEHLMTVEFFRELKSLLSSDGVLVSNTFAISDLYDHESATYAAVFGSFINFQISESANRLVIAPNQQVTDEQLRARADQLAAALRPYSVPLHRYARTIIRQRDDKPDWDEDAKLLTDQYSPANLLRARGD